MNDIKNVIYCPICRRHLAPENAEDIESGRADRGVYVHDDVSHSEDDIKALDAGRQ
jgi:hypothetical protein